MSTKFNFWLLGFVCAFALVASGKFFIAPAKPNGIYGILGEYVPVTPKADRGQKEINSRKHKI